MIGFNENDGAVSYDIAYWKNYIKQHLLNVKFSKAIMEGRMFSRMVTLPVISDAKNYNYFYSIVISLIKTNIDNIAFRAIRDIKDDYNFISIVKFRDSANLRFSAYITKEKMLIEPDCIIKNRPIVNPYNDYWY